jgi:hypothetical protein
VKIKKRKEIRGTGQKKEEKAFEMSTDFIIFSLGQERKLGGSRPSIK